MIFAYLADPLRAPIIFKVLVAQRRISSHFALLNSIFLLAIFLKTGMTSWDPVSPKALKKDAFSS